jgi:putative GTP pyrophosphokinase
MLADLLLQQDDVRLIQRKDYIKHPKPNGYRSLHLIVELPIFLANEKKWVKVEVQFRTLAMDLWASLEHKLRYKKDLPQERLDEISHDLLECALICASLDKKMGELRKSEKRNPIVHP